MAGLQNRLPQKQTKRIRAAQRGSEYGYTMNKTRRQPSTRQRKDKHVGRFKLFLHRRINTVHEFSCTRNAVCVHVMYTVLTVRKLCPFYQFSRFQQYNILDLVNYVNLIPFEYAGLIFYGPSGKK